MSILEQINELLYSNLTTALAEHLADEFGLNKHDVTSSVKQYLALNTTSSNHPLVFIQKGDEISTNNSVKTVDTCGYLIKRGEHKGKICGAKIRGGGGELCSKHR